MTTTNTTEIILDATFSLGDTARSRAVRLAAAALHLVERLQRAGFQVKASAPYRRTVELSFDNGGRNLDSRFGTLVVSAITGKVLRMVVERFDPEDPTFTHALTDRHQGHPAAAGAVRGLTG